jgi:chromosome segregation ATPase
LELSNLRSTSEARIEQMSAELNDAASALESEREAWFRRQDGARADFKQQTDTLQEKLETTMEVLERERNTSFDYKERVEELQIQIRKSEEHVSELKRRVSFLLNF